MAIGPVLGRSGDHEKWTQILPHEQVTRDLTTLVCGSTVQATPICYGIIYNFSQGVG